MDIKTKGYFPYVVTAKTKTSKAGNEYLSIGIGRSEKNQSGEYETKWLNLLDKRDLLVLASACENAYHKIVEAEQEERSGGAATSKGSNTNGSFATPAPTNIDDDIPF